MRTCLCVHHNHTNKGFGREMLLRVAGEVRTALVSIFRLFSDASITHNDLIRSHHQRRLLNLCSAFTVIGGGG